MTTYKILRYLGHIVSFILSIMYLANYRVLSKPLKIFSIFLFLLASVNFSGFVLGQFRIHNIFLWHYFNYIEWFLMSSFFVFFYPDNYKNLVKGVCILVLLIMLYGSIFINAVTEFNILGYFALKLMITIMGLIEVYKNQLISKNHYYYLNIGTVFLSVVSICYFTFWNLRITDAFSKEGKMVLMIVNSSAFVIGLIFYFIEFYKSKLWKASKELE